MTVGLMRKVDYWIGTPLCFLLTGVNYVSRLLSFKKNRNSNVKKILFIKLAEMGSIIVALPLIEHARNEYPEADIFFLTFKKNAAVLRILGIAKYCKILTITDESPPAFILNTLRAIKRIKQERIDVVFDLELFSRFTSILAYLSGAHERIGFYRYCMEGLYRGNLLTHKVQYNSRLHISKSFLSLWQTLKQSSKATPELEKEIGDNEITLPRINSSNEARERMMARLKESGVSKESKLFLINPGEGGLPLREWPIDNFITLSKMLIEDNKNFIIIVGTQNVLKKANMIRNVLGGKKCIDFSNKTTLSELLTLFGIANALISNDCGLAHLASLTSIRKFVLFGPESPQVYSPLGDNTWIMYSGLPCSPCLSAFNHRNSLCKDNRCLKAVKPDDVFNLIERNL